MLRKLDITENGELSKEVPPKYCLPPVHHECVVGICRQKSFLYPFPSIARRPYCPVERLQRPTMKLLRMLPSAGSANPSCLRPRLELMVPVPPEHVALMHLGFDRVAEWQIVPSRWTHANLKCGPAWNKRCKQNRRLPYQ